jgi:hypothetical protein
MTTTAMKILFVIFLAGFAPIQSGKAGIGFGAIPGSLTFDSLVSVKKHPATLTTKPVISSPKGELAHRHVTRSGKMLRLTSR